LRSLRILTALVLALFAVAAAVRAADRGPGSPLRIHLLWTNDLHGHIAPESARFMNPEFPPPLGGAASAAGYIKRVRAAAAAAGEPVLLVDVGDMFQGTPIGNKTQGEAVIEYFNAVGYDFAVPGNHDFDLGREVTEARARQSRFPWLAANLVDTATGEIVPWCQPTLMLDLGGVRLGVIGIITSATKTMSFAEHVQGLDFLPLAPVIAKYRDELRAQGADLIFLAIHEGLPYDPQAGWQRIVGSEQTDATGEQTGGYGTNYSGDTANLMEIVNEVPGIDVAVGGHTHRGYQEPWIDPVHHTLCFESFGNGSSLGHAILLVDRQTRALVGWEPSHDQGTLVTLFADELQPDPEIVELLRPYQEQAEREMARVVGEAGVALPRGSAGASLMGNLVTDAMRERFDADFAFQNLGGLRADLPAGPVTAGDIFSVLPFGNELCVVEMDGRMLRRIIERKVVGTSGGLCVAGVRMAFDPGRPDWDRVVTLEIRGEPWDPDRLYKAVCPDFLLEGTSGLDFLTAIPAAAITPTKVLTAEALEWYFAKHSPVRPQVDDRWVEAPGQPQAPYLAVPYLP